VSSCGIYVVREFAPQLFGAGFLFAMEVAMPEKAYKPCTYPGCYALTKSRRCEKHSRSLQKDYDNFKRDKNSRAFYKSTAWKKCRKAVLARDNYLCQYCLQVGRLRPATTVHHKQHLREDRERALDADNLISLCAACHNTAHGQ